MTSAETNEWTSLEPHCLTCSHAARLHLDEGCAACRCDCWLRRDQVEALAGRAPRAAARAHRAERLRTTG